MTSGSADMLDYSTYIADFRCENDKNGYGILNLKVGMLTYDKMVHAEHIMGLQMKTLICYLNIFGA